MNKDGYNRPKTTYQDTLTEKDIKEQLKDYTSVVDVIDLPINTHIRYFVLNKSTGERKFRLGGYITKIEPKKGYIILSNGKTSWSVQIKNTIFFKKMSIDEIREEYEQKIVKYKKEIKKLKQSLHDIKKTLGKK